MSLLKKKKIANKTLIRQRQDWKQLQVKLKPSIMSKTNIV